MPDDIIRDPSTGHQVALVIEGQLYSTDGEFLGHLENSDNVQSGTAPESLMKLLKTRT